MKKLILLILLWSCSSPFYPFIQSEEDEEISSITFELDNEVDENGFIHIISNPNVFQTLYRISGHLYRDGLPMNITKMVWGSSHYWIYDDLGGYIKFFGENEYFYVGGSTPPTDLSEHSLVPIINSSSYSREDGEVNTMMGVLNIMKGDTIEVMYGYYDDWKSEETYGEFYVILQKKQKGDNKTMIKGKIKNVLDMDFNIQLPQKYVQYVSSSDWTYMTIGGVGSVVRQIHNQLKKVGKMSFDKLWVKTESYSGGNSVRIYLLNPSEETYELSKSLMNIFQYGQFNGMIDLYENSPSDTQPLLTFENGREIEVSSKYNMTHNKPPYHSKEYEMLEELV